MNLRQDLAAKSAAVVEVKHGDRLDILETRRRLIRVRTREGVAVEYPYFDLLGHQVWGATAMILGEFICLLQD